MGAAFTPSRFASPLAREIEAVLLQELADGGTVRSLGVLYGLLMGAANWERDEPNQFQPVNRAIIDATDGKPEGRLDRIKAVGHKVLERALAAKARGEQQ